MIGSHNEKDELAKQRKFYSHSEVIREYSRILADFDETERCADAIDILLHNTHDTIKAIWEIIITGINYKFMKKYDNAFEAFSRLNGIIFKHNLLLCFVLKEELYVYAAMDKYNICECIARYDALIDCFKNDKDVDIQLQVAQIMLYKENLSAELKKYEDCIKQDDAIIKKYGGIIDQEEYCVLVQKAMCNKVKYLGCLNRKKESLNTLKKIIKKYA